MKTNEMYFMFQTLLETTAPAFADSQRPDSDTVFRFLNMGYDAYIKQKYLSQPTAAENVLFIQRKADDLRNLITMQDGLLLSSVIGPGNRFMVQLPDNYLFYVRSDSKINRTDLPVVTDGWVPNKVASYEDISKITTSVYNQPVLKELVVVFQENHLMLYADNYTMLTDLQLTYLRKPKTLVLTVTNSATETDECELAFHTHEEIVQFSVNLYLTEYKFRLQAVKE